MPTLLGKPQRSLLDTLAEHFAVTWEPGDGPGTVRIARGRTRFAIEVSEGEIPRLRFDKVALGLIRRLQVALDEAVPAGSTLIVTITAPIHVAARTAAALESELRPWLSHRSRRVSETRHTLHGNQIRARLVKGNVAGALNVIGFVHNPNPGCGVLLDLAQSLIERIAATGSAH